MFDQQSSSVPDPRRRAAVPDLTRHPRRATSRSLGLTDQEAFTLLAESMAESGPDGSGMSTPPTSSRSLFPAGRRVTDHDRNQFDWSTPALLGDHRTQPPDASDDIDTPSIVQGRVTEVIDLASIPPILIRTDDDGQITVLESGCIIGPTDTPAPAESTGQTDSRRRGRSPFDETVDGAALPPLVFMNTRGDIVPPFGAPNLDPEEHEGAEPGSFEEVGRGWTDLEPLGEGTTRLAEAEIMADSKAEKETSFVDRSTPDRGRVSDDHQAFFEEQPIAYQDDVTVHGETVAVDESSFVAATAFDERAGFDDDMAIIEYPVPMMDDRPPPPGLTGLSGGHTVGRFEDLADQAVDGLEGGRLGFFEAPTPKSEIRPASAPSPEPSGPDAVRLQEFERTFDQYSGPIIAVIASIAPDRQSVDEALQATFEAVWQSAHAFEPDRPRGPWMFSLARRLATEQLEAGRRRERGTKPGRYPVPSHRFDEATAIDKSWEAWEVRLAVDQLTQAEHDVLRLTHNGGRIHPEIASDLQTTVGAVKSHSYSGSHRLVKLLDHVIRPDTEEPLSTDRVTALTWYLAGVADGSDLNADERSNIKRVQAHLSSASAWITPDPHAWPRLVAFARRSLADPGPLPLSGRHLDPVADAGLGQLVQGVDGEPTTVNRPVPGATGEHAVIDAGRSRRRPPYTPIALGVIAIVAAVLIVPRLTGGSDTDETPIRIHQMQATPVDADATAVLRIADTPTGSEFRFEFGGLDASRDGSHYVAWLQSTAGGTVVPLGSFSWQASGDPVTMVGPTWSDDYDTVVVTRSNQGTRASIDDQAVLTVSIE